MNELRLARIPRNLLRKTSQSGTFRKARKRLEDRFPLARPMIRSLLGEAPATMKRNGVPRRRTSKPAKRRAPYEMALGFSLPFLAGSNGSSRLSVRTLFRLER